jgi:lysophospholipase L1-like esterase
MQTRCLSTIFLLFLATIDLASSPPPAVRDSTVPGRERIVVLGSSTAAGTGVSRPESAWVNLYAASLRMAGKQVEIVNLAVGGYVTYQVLPLSYTPPPGRPPPSPGHTISDALVLHPCAIIVNLPSNDAASGIPVREQLANYDTLLNRAAANEVPIWIATPQPRNMADSLRQWQMSMRDSVESRLGDRSIDFWRGLASASGGILPEYDGGDGIHLNDRGHRILFERVVLKRIPESSCRREP